MIPFISGVGLVFSLFLLMLFVNTPISNVLENIRNMFRDPEHQDHNIVLKTKKLIGDIFMLYGRKQLVLYILLMVYAIIGLILKRLEIIVSNKYETIGLLFAACVFIMRVLLALRFNKAASTALNFVSLSFSFLFVFLCLLYDQWYQIGWLYLVSVLAVFVVNTGGNNGLSMASYPLVLAAVSGLMMLDNIQMEEEEKKPHHLIPRFFLYFAVIVLLINTGYYRITSVYRDEKLSVLTSVLEDGPGAGIYTTRDASEQYRSVLRDLADNKSDNEHGPVLISKLMPFGYMYLERPAAAPNVWRTYMNETRLSVFYERHPQLIPETIVVLDAGTGFHNQNNPMGGYFNERFLSEEYSSIIKETAVIYQRSKHVSNRQYYSTNKRDRVH